MAQSKTVADSAAILIRPFSGQTVDTVKVIDTSGDVQFQISAAGVISMPNLPTSSTGTAGDIYSDSNVLTLSTT